MKKLFLVLGITLFVFLTTVSVLLIYVSNALPDVGPAPDITVESTTERIERGHYLANTVMACMHCHTPQDKSRLTHPIDEKMLGAGGNRFGPEEGLPGNYYAPNLTPSHLGDWSDGELFRAITSGVSKDGHALFPIMPYPNYAKVSEEDIYAVITYLRTLEPIEHEVPPSESFFPMNFILNTIPAKAEMSNSPDTNDPVSWGKYIVTSASCIDCHTPKDKGENIPGMEFAGGMQFVLEDGSLNHSANITPHVETGIGSWTEEQFLKRFKDYADSSFVYPEIEKGNFNTFMPWKTFSKMSDEELKAIFAYLRTVEPVSNEVQTFVATVN